MSMLKGFVIAATLAASTSVFASAPARISDAQYLAVARCDGLADSKALGASDAAAMDSVYKDQGKGRAPAIAERADDERSAAIRQADHSGPTVRAGLVSERDGACQALAHPAPGMAGGSGSASGAN